MLFAAAASPWHAVLVSEKVSPSGLAMISYHRNPHSENSPYTPIAFQVPFNFVAALVQAWGELTAADCASRGAIRASRNMGLATRFRCHRNNGGDRGAYQNIRANRGFPGLATQTPTHLPLQRRIWRTSHCQPALWDNGYYILLKLQFPRPTLLPSRNAESLRDHRTLDRVTDRGAAGIFCRRKFFS